MSFIFGGNTGLTYEQARKKREIAEALRGQMSRAPQNVGEGLHAIGQALAIRGLTKRADAADKKGRSKADSVFSALLGRKALPSAIGGQAGGSAAPSYAAPVNTDQADPRRGMFGTGSSTEKPEDMASRVKAGLVQRGLPEHVADGFVMNFKDESGLRTDINEIAPIVPGSRGGFGLAQWTGPRRRELEAFAGQRGTEVSDLDTQLDFLMHELGGSEARAAKSIMAAGDAGSAATAIVNDFLRPAEQHRAARAARYGGQQGGQGQRVAGGGPSTQELMAAMANPYMRPEQKQALGMMLQQQMQASDPMRQLQLEKAQLDLERARNPQADPMKAIQLETAQLELEKARKQPTERKMLKAADDRYRYADGDKELVFPNVQAGDESKDMTESERRIFMFTQMQQDTGPVINLIEEKGFDPSNFKDRFANGVLGGNFVKSQDGQMYDAGANAWSEAALRLATGAAATPEEHARIKGTYFAQVGDSLETIEFKRAMRASYEDVLQRTLSGEERDAPNPLMFAAQQIYADQEVPTPAGQPAPAPAQAAPQAPEWYSPENHNGIPWGVLWENMTPEDRKEFQ